MKEYDCILFTDGGPSLFYQKALGAYKIAHMLRQSGYSCLVIDHFKWFKEEDIVPLLKNAVSNRTKFVGFSTSFFGNLEGFDLFTNDSRYEPRYKILDYNKTFCPQGKKFEELMVATIKSLNTTCKIVIGGTQTMSNQLSNRNVDYIVIGYAEHSAVSLMKHLDKNESLQCTKNLYGVTLVDDRMAAGYVFADCTMEWLPEDVFGVRVLPIEISRGCVFNCSFCQYPMRGKKTNDHIRLADHIYNELQTNYDRYGISTYYIIDDTFNDSDEKIDAFAAAVKKLSFQPIFWCYARLDLFVVHPDRIKKLYDIGVRSMFLGIETLNRKAGLAIGKGMHPHKLISTLQSMNKMYGDDLKTHGAFIVGLPHENFDSIDQTVNLIITGEAPLHSVNFESLIMFKSATWWFSNIDKNYEKYGYKEDLSQIIDAPWYHSYHTDWLMWRNEHMTFRQADKKANEVNSLFWGWSKTEGIDAFSMLNSDLYTWDQLKGMTYTELEMDFDRIQLKKIHKFIAYQQYLKDLLTTT